MGGRPTCEGDGEDEGEGGDGAAPGGLAVAGVAGSVTGTVAGEAGMVVTVATLVTGRDRRRGSTDSNGRK